MNKNLKNKNKSDRARKSVYQISKARKSLKLEKLQYFVKVVIIDRQKS